MESQAGLEFLLIEGYGTARVKFTRFRRVFAYVILINLHVVASFALGQEPGTHPRLGNGPPNSAPTTSTYKLSNRI
jgi:hypothetical protein